MLQSIEKKWESYKPKQKLRAVLETTARSFQFNQY